MFQVISYYFLVLFQSFRLYIKVFDPLWVDFGTRWKNLERSRFTYTSEYPVFPATFFLRGCLFSIMCFELLCQRSVGYRYMGLCLDLLFWPIGLPVCFCANTTLFLLLWLCSIVWIGCLLNIWSPLLNFIKWLFSFKAWFLKIWWITLIGFLILNYLCIFWMSLIAACHITMF
jgi:hypothetical protein